MTKRAICLIAFCFIFSLIFSFTASVSFAQEDPSHYDAPLLLRVHIEDREKQLPILASFHLAVAGLSTKESTVDVMGDYDTYLMLTATGFETNIIRDLTPTTEEILALQDYLDPSEVQQMLEDYETNYPSLAKRYIYSYTEEGRPIWDMKISDNVAVEEDEPAIIFVGQHHANEVMTPEIMIDIVDYLLTNYASDPEVQYWIDNFEIWVRVSHNPDGTNYVFTVQSSWRKNRHDNGDGNYGVDNNRNYPFKWGACGGSSGSTSSPTYRGPSPASELETQGIMDFTEEHRPVLNLSYHSSGELVIHPFGCSGEHPSPPELRVSRQISSALASIVQRDSGSGYYENGTGWEILYAVDGEMNDWFYGEMGSMGFTFELNQSQQPNYDTYRDPTVLKHRPAWKYFLNRLDGSSIYGHTQDACTGDPLSAELSLDEVVFTYGEHTRTSEPLYGRYQWLTMPGLFHINFSKEGYYSQNWPVEVGFVKTLKEGYLVPEGSYNLEYYSHLIDDSGHDNDAEADPGETVIMPITIYATGGDITSISATLSTSDTYISIIDGSASFPNLLAGETGESLADHFSFAVSPDAPDGHEAQFNLAYSSNEVLCQAESTFIVPITKGFRSCPFVAEYFDADPGWTIENNGADGWEFGSPTGTGGPPSAYTGTNVYGTNLDGSHGSNGDFILTSQPFDLRGLRNAELKFMRWLENEAGFDIASIEYSLDGVEFHEIWKGFGRDEEWEEHRYDISSWADQEEIVYIRFRLQSDGNTNWSGFYIDDVEICGEEVPGSAGKVRYNNHTIDDSDPNYGNNDGIVDTGETVTVMLEVRNTKDTEATVVSGILTTTTEGVTINNNYATFPNIAAGSLAMSQSPHITFTVNSGCGMSIAFTLETRYDNGSSAISQFQIHVGEKQYQNFFEDDMESDTGWTTSSSSGADGLWVRDDPFGVTDAWDQPVQPEDDTTPDPGTDCWITENKRKPKNPKDYDVDGTVTLYSPLFSAEEGVEVKAHYQRFFYYTSGGSGDSYFGAYYSTNGGSSWMTLETVESMANAWTLKEYDLPYVSSEMQLRFEVNEASFIGDLLLEGLVDDVLVDGYKWFCQDFTPPVVNPPNSIAESLMASKVEGHVYLEWDPPAVDGTHDVATSYRVYRSLQPDTGFEEIGHPTSPFYYDVDVLGAEESYYYKVKAENGGGISD